MISQEDSLSPNLSKQRGVMTGEDELRAVRVPRHVPEKSDHLRGEVRVQAGVDLVDDQNAASLKNTLDLITQRGERTGALGLFLPGEGAHRETTVVEEELRGPSTRLCDHC